MLFMLHKMDMLVDYRSSSGGGTVILDDCNFHESVRLDKFDEDRTLTLVSVLLSYPYLVDNKEGCS